MTTDETIRATIDAVLGIKRLSLVDLAAGTGIPKASIYYKRDHGFAARDVAAIAAYLGVAVGDLYSGRVDVRALTDNPQVTDWHRAHYPTVARNPFGGGRNRCTYRGGAGHHVRRESHGGIRPTPCRHPFARHRAMPHLLAR